MKRKLTPKDFVGLPFKKRGRANVAKRPTKVHSMPKQWTIEVRAAVPHKHLAVMKNNIIKAAQHVLATAILCTDDVDTLPQVVAYSDDFYAHEDIDIPPFGALRKVPRKRRSA